MMVITRKHASAGLSGLLLGIIIAPDKSGTRKIHLLFLHENICRGYSVEAPGQRASNECPQHIFSWRIKENQQFLVENKCLIWSYGIWLVFLQQVTNNIPVMKKGRGPLYLTFISLQSFHKMMDLALCLGYLPVVLGHFNP